MAPIVSLVCDDRRVATALDIDDPALTITAKEKVIAARDRWLLSGEVNHLLEEFQVFTGDVTLKPNRRERIDSPSGTTNLAQSMMQVHCKSIIQ
jgi:hypothetical protein